MTKSLLPAVLLLLATGLAAHADSTGPLIVSPPNAQWTVKYKKDDHGETYTLVPPTGQDILLTFSRWPAPGNAQQMPGFLETMADKFADQAQRNPNIQLASTDYTKGEFIGGTSSSPSRAASSRCSSCSAKAPASGTASTSAPTPAGSTPWTRSRRSRRARGG
jgi:hypothetical protein